MVATLLSLKFRLTIAELKRSVARLVLWILMGVYALSLIGALLIGLGFSSTVIAGHEGLAGSLTVVAGSILVLGWTFLPLVFFGSDQTLDPARFVQFPLTGRELAPGLVVAGIMGLPGFFTALVCVGMALPWLNTPLVLVVGVIGGLLGFLMTQIGCRLATTLLSGTLSSRKGRDLTGVIGLILILILSMAGYGISLIGGNISTDSGQWTQLLSISKTVGNVLAMTPLGAPWALASDAGQGHWGMLAVHFVLTLAYMGLGMWAYGIVLDKALLATTRVAVTRSVTKGDAIAKAANWRWAKGAFIPVAAITARALRYWRKDPRYLGTIPAILIMPILFTVMGRTLPLMDDTGATPAWLITGMVAFGLGFTALLTGYSMSTDVAFDSTAWWIHLASGVKGWQDRLGRAIGEAVWAIPLLVAIGIAVPLIMGASHRIVPVMAAMMSLYLSSLGIASIFSALIIYPVALPGESPLKMKTGMMGSQMLSQMGCMLASGIVGLPVCVWAIFATGWQAWVALLASIVWGAGVLTAGIILGGKVMDWRGPAILQTLKKNDSAVRA